MYKNVKPILPLMYAWEFMPRPETSNSEGKPAWKRDWAKLARMALKYNWQHDISYLKELYRVNSHAVVVTEINQNILYVGGSFDKMTGYSAAEVMGKRPNLFQGPKTEPSARQQIKKAIDAAENVHVQLTNYRKNGELYLCDINIQPIFDKNNQLVNFLALEKELPLTI